MRKLSVFLLVLLISNYLFAQTEIKKLYVINDWGSETLSSVDLISGTVNTSIAVLGNVPNDIQIKNNTGYIVNSTSADIYVFDVTSETVIDTISLLPNSNPIALAVAENGIGYVSNLMLNSVSKVDLNSGTVLNSIDVGTQPQGMFLDGDFLYVANTGYVSWGVYAAGTISVIDTRADTTLTTLSVPHNPRSFTKGADGKIYVICTGDYAGIEGHLAVIDPDGGIDASPVSADSINIGGQPSDLKITSDGKIFIAAGGSGWTANDSGYVFVYDTVNDTLLNSKTNPVITGNGAGRIAFDSKNGSVLVSCYNAGTVEKIDPASREITDIYEVGISPAGMAVYSGTVAGIPGEQKIIADSFELKQNYPNPFNPSTTIGYNLRKSGKVILNIYSVDGRLVKKLVDDIQPQGLHTVTFNGFNLASGVYIYTLKTETGTKTRKMLLIK